MRRGRGGGRMPYADLLEEARERIRCDGEGEGVRRTGGEEEKESSGSEPAVVELEKGSGVAAKRGRRRHVWEKAGSDQRWRDPAASGWIRAWVRKGEGYVLGRGARLTGKGMEEGKDNRGRRKKEERRKRKGRAVRRKKRKKKKGKKEKKKKETVGIWKRRKGGKTKVGI